MEFALSFCKNSATNNVSAVIFRIHTNGNFKQTQNASDFFTNLALYHFNLTYCSFWNVILNSSAVYVIV